MNREPWNASLPGDLWSEGGDVLWLHRDLARTAERAKRIAFTGRGLPETFLGGERFGYDLLAVREATLRPGETDEWGWAGRGAETWYECDPRHPKAEPYFEITVQNATAISHERGES